MSDDVLNTCLPCVMTEFLYVSNKQIDHFTRNSVLRITTLTFDFSKKISHHGNNYECIILADIRHSQPHMNFYYEVIILSWGGVIFHKVESLMMILFLASLASFSPIYSGGITMLLCSPCIDTCKNKLELIFGGVTINGDVKTNIFCWRFYNLMIVYNPIIKGFFEILIFFCMNTALCNV